MASSDASSLFNEGIATDERNHENALVSRWAKVKAFLKNTVAEPFFLLIMFSYTTKAITFQELIQYKTCTYDLHYNVSICDDLQNKNYSEIQDEVQRITGNITMGHSIINLLPSIIAVVFIVSFSVKYGRKVPIILSSFGMLLETVGVIICTLDMHSSAMLLLLTSIPGGLLGGLMVTITMAMSYLSETAEPENRPLRFALMEVAMLTAAPAGGAYGGYLRSKYGFISVFLTSGIVMFLAILWIFFRMTETKKQKITNCKEALRDLVNLDGVKNNVRVTIKKREGNSRLKIWLLILSATANLFVMMGLVNIGFLFAQRTYKWKNVQYSLVNALASVFQMVAMMIAVPILTKVIQVHESVLIIIGSVSNAAKLIVWCSASTVGLYFHGYILGVLSGTANVGVKSYLARLIDASEIASVFSVMALCEGLAPLIGSALWTQIYNASLPDFPGLAYLCCSFLMIIPISVALWILVNSKDIPDSANKKGSTEGRFSDSVMLEEVKRD